MRIEKYLCFDTHSSWETIHEVVSKIILSWVAFVIMFVILISVLFIHRTISYLILDKEKKIHSKQMNIFEIFKWSTSEPAYLNYLDLYVRF